LKLDYALENISERRECCKRLNISINLDCFRTAQTTVRNYCNSKKMLPTLIKNYLQFRRLMQIGIIIYIAVFAIWMKKGYQEFSNVESSVTTKVKGTGTSHLDTSTTKNNGGYAKKLRLGVARFPVLCTLLTNKLDCLSLARIVNLLKCLQARSQKGIHCWSYLHIKPHLVTKTTAYYSEEPVIKRSTALTRSCFIVL
jgi:hypothetical protein